MPAGSTETPVLDLLAKTTVSSFDASGLDARTLMLARIAALSPLMPRRRSYMLNLGVASDAGVDEQDVRDVLAAVAPIVGTPRTVAALSNMVRALGSALELAEGDEGASRM